MADSKENYQLDLGSERVKSGSVLFFSCFFHLAFAVILVAVFNELISNC